MKFEQLVNQLQVGVRFDLPNDCKFLWVNIDRNKDYYTGEITYSWALKRNYYVCGSTGYVFPLNGQFVKQWKTEKGARRNLIATFGMYFDEYLNDHIVQAKKEE